MNPLQFLLGALQFIGVFGLFFNSKSSSSSAPQDRRNSVGEGGVGVSGDRNSVVVTDSGLVSRGLDTVDLSIANLGIGYETLIDASREIFNSGQGLIGQTQKAVADAYGQAQANTSQTIDNRTLIALAVAGAAALFVLTRNR